MCPSLGLTALSPPWWSCLMVPSPFGSSSGMLPAFRITFSAYRQNRSNLVFFLGFNFFPFFVLFFLKKKKKAPLQSVIPINIIHLKNSIYIFIYRFLYIYFYVQDGLALCPRSISVGAGDGLGFIALGFQSLPFTRDALKTQRHPARRHQNKIKRKES